MNLDLTAVRRAATVLDRAAATLPRVPAGQPIPGRCPLAGAAAAPYERAVEATERLIRTLARTIATVAADLSTAAARAERADHDSAAPFARLTAEPPPWA